MEKNRENAIAFLKAAGLGKVDEAFNRYVAPHFIHHNQYFDGSRESLRNAMAEAHQESPNKSIDIKQSFVDGDTIVTHSYVVKETMEIAVVHIFRFEEHRIAELWDLGQVIDKDSPNENGLF
ncbi:MAG: polyketide cyclase [Flavobacteriaceae bacterium]|nr:polyketide cyclase [Flavobacteriaceae bacterium]